MKIRMKVAISGTRGGVDWPGIGETLDVSDEEGAQLCAGGMADPVAELPKAEKATAPKAETRKVKE